MEKRWLISAMAAMAMMAMPALAEDKVAEEGTPPAPGVQVEAPAPEAVDESAADTPTEAAKKNEPVTVALGTGTPMPTPPAEKEPEPPAPPKFTYGATADFYFSSNFNNPGDGLNGLGIFDFKDEHGPHLNYAEVWAQYARDPIGFRLDLMWGPGGRIVNF